MDIYLFKMAATMVGPKPNKEGRVQVIHLCLAYRLIKGLCQTMKAQIWCLRTMHLIRAAPLFAWNLVNCDSVKDKRNTCMRTSSVAYEIFQYWGMGVGGSYAYHPGNPKVTIRAIKCSRIEYSTRHTHAWVKNPNKNFWAEYSTTAFWPSAFLTWRQVIFLNLD